MLRIPGFTDGSTFLRQGNCKVGYAVTATDKVMNAKPLPVGRTSQKAERFSLTRALDVWTDSESTFWGDRSSQYHL